MGCLGALDKLFVGQFKARARASVQEERSHTVVIYLGYLWFSKRDNFGGGVAHSLSDRFAGSCVIHKTICLFKMDVF